MLQYGQTLKTLYEVKDSKQKRSYIILFHLNEISRLDKSIETKCKLVVARGWDRVGDGGTNEEKLFHELGILLS